MDITYATLDPLMRVVTESERQPECPSLTGRAGMDRPERLEKKDDARTVGVAMEALKRHAITVRGAYAVSAHD